MDGVVFAADPAPLPVKLVVACLAGLLPAVLSRRVRADGNMLVASCLIACASAAIAVHCVLFEDPGLIAGFVGLIIGVLVLVLAFSRRASVFAASSISVASLVTVGATLFTRMPPSEMRRQSLVSGSAAVSSSNRTIRERRIAISGGSHSSTPRSMTVNC